MGGPIVRTGTTPEFWKNWDNVFGGKKSAKGTKSAETKAEKKPAKKKSAKKKSAKKSK